MLKTLFYKLSIIVSHLEKVDQLNSSSSNKNHTLPFSHITLQSTNPLKIIFSDLWGPSPLLSIDKKLYHVIFVDQFTKYICIYTVKNKSEVKTICFFKI